MKKLAFALALAAWAGLAAAQATVVGSPHDLSPTGGAIQSTGAGTVAGAVAQGQICVYCHMPHNANNAGAPLWNRTNATANTGFLMYSKANSATFALNPADTNTAARVVGPVSMACLSCHDGATAFNSLNQSPMFDTDAGRSSRGSNYTFATVTGGVRGAAVANMGDVAATGGEVSPNLGTDLTNDHPISFQYDAALATLKGTTLANPTSTPTTTGGGTLVIFRSGGAAGTDTIQAQMLFSKPGSAVQDQLECASCHEPHMHGDSATAASNFPFLIKSNQNSQLCLTCHNK
jgi:predicted CXXCH cytochrome family protein